MRPHGALEKDKAKVCNGNMFFCVMLVFPVKQVVSHSVEHKLEFIKVYYWAETVC